MQPGTDIRSAGAGLFGYFARHRTAANLLMVLLLLSGFAAATQIRSQFFPDVVIEAIVVETRWEGAGPEDVDAGIVALLEPALRAVEGVESSRAYANTANAWIRLEFEPGWDITRALSDVERAVAEAGQLPEGADAPEIRRRWWGDRVTDVTLHGPVRVETLSRFAEDFTSRLYRAGVTRTHITGVADPVIRVEVPEARLAEHELSLRDIAGVISAHAEAEPAGDLGTSGPRIRAGNERREAETIAALPLRPTEDGGTLRIGDVSDVRTLSADSGIALTREGQPAVRIRIDRSARGDAIAIQDTVARIADELQAELPEGVEINLVNARADNITDRLDLLLRNGLAGLALVLMLLFLFLSGRSAIWVAAGIPVAMAAALAAMWVGGLTLNMVSLFGLLLCLGLVVDDAIVVAEHADWRRRHLDEGPAEAAENAARRMALPVFCAMITTVLAFAALTAVGGRFGRMVSDIPFTVIAVLAASLVECFLILPHHMARALAGDLKNRWIDAPSRAVNRGLRSFRERAFKPAIGWVIRLRYPIIAAALLLLAQSVALFLRGDVPWRFFVSPDRGTVTVNLAMLPGATRTDTTAMVRELERATAAVDAAFAEEHGLAPVEWSVASVGDTVGRGLSGDGSKPPDALGGLEIGLTDPDLRSYSSHDFVARLREAVVRSPEVETLSFRSWRGGPGGDGIDVALMGGDVRRLKAAAEDLKAALASEAGVFGLEDSLSYDRTELILDLTPQGARLGFDIDAVGAELFARLSGVKAAEFPLAGASAEVRVSLPEEDITADYLDRARLPAPDGAQVPLAEIVEVESRPGFASLERENGLPVVRVTGGISEDDPEAASAIESRMRAEILPIIAETHGVEYSLGGLAEQESRFLSEAAVGFTLCAAGIYLTLAWVFSSWVRPLIVLAVIPFGLVGTIFGHLHWDLALSMFSVVGLIGLAGIIVNNAIVLISTVDSHAERRALAPSLVEAAGDRLRPVLLTTLTTVLGLTPLLFERSRQALFLKPTVVTLVYGLGIGAVLTMVLVPALLMVQHDISRALLALRRSLRLRSRSRPATLLWAVLVCVALSAVAALLLPSGAGDAAATWIPRALFVLALAAGIGGLALGSMAARR